MAEQLTFNDLLAERNLHLRPEDLTFAGSLVTPPFSPFRFDTAFFVAMLPPGQTAEVWPGELTEGAWHSAERVLADWMAGDSLVSPPTVALLEAIRDRPVEELSQCIRPVLEAIERGGIHPIWFSPAVQMIPLFAQGLPPSTHTNAYLVGTDHAYLLDPGATDPGEQARLFDVLDGRHLRGVVLTHHHPDHIGAANACAQRYGVPILAHPLTAQALSRARRGATVSRRWRLSRPGAGARRPGALAPAGDPHARPRARSSRFLRAALSAAVRRRHGFDVVVRGHRRRRRAI